MVVAAAMSIGGCTDCQWVAALVIEERVLLTESTVESMFRALINDPEKDEETLDKAEELLEDELRPESPLRHRLSVELEELRTLAAKG